ncbi:MAG: hypothetical protein Q8O46_04495 [bacterium]|nr:hypothetical protein [bacterium]
MNFKKILIIIFLVSVFFPVYGAVAATPTPEPTKDTIKNTVEAIPSSVENIQKIVQEKTPEFVVRPILYVIDKAEGFRKNIKMIFESRKEDVEVKIEFKKEILNNKEDAQKELPDYSVGLTELFNAFKYLEVFILVFLIFIFSVPWLFYTLVVLLIILISRFFWVRIY